MSEPDVPTASPVGYHLVRHGWADWEAVGRCAPGLSTDLVPLTRAGEERMLTASERLRTSRPRRIVTSPLTRALQSAHVLSRELDLPLTIEPDLREWTPSLTSTDGERAAFQRALADMLAADGEWPAGRPQRWEPLSAVRRRVAQALSGYGADTVVVTHGVVIYALTGQDVPPGAVVRLSGRELAAERPPVAPLASSGPPTAAQEFRLLHETAEPGPLWDQVALVWGMNRRVEVPALDRALLRLVARHPLLRCRFARKGDGSEFRREVLEHGEIACWVVDEERHGAGPAAWIRADVHDRLSGLEWPLLRATVVRGDPDLLSLVAHGLIVHKAALRQLGAELIRLYTQEAGPSDPSGAVAPLRAAPADTRSWAGGQAHRPVTLLDAGLVQKLLRRYGGSGCGLLDVVLAALSHAPATSGEAGDTPVLVLSRAGAAGHPRSPDGPATRAEPVALPTAVAPGAVAALRRAGPGAAPLDLSTFRYVVDYEPATPLTTPVRDGEPGLAAWRCAAPVLAFEERGGELIGWQPLSDGRSRRPAPHQEVARVLRRWAQG